MRRGFFNAVAVVPQDPVAPHGLSVRIVGIFGDGFAISTRGVEVESSITRFEEVGPANMSAQVRLFPSRLGGGRSASKNRLDLLRDVGELLILLQVNVFQPSHGKLFLRFLHFGGAR